jgi:hypothetical protein
MSRNGKDAKPNGEQGLTQGEQMANALDWIVNDKIFADVQLHGNVKWFVLDLVRVAVLWVWSSKHTLVESANDAIEKSRELFSSVGIKSYQVLTNALVKYTSQILPPLQKRMHQLMENVNSSGFRMGLWVVLAVDGSRLNVPRTRANEQRFCKPTTKRKKRHNKKKNRRGRHATKRTPVSRKKHYNPQPVGPQTWLTLLWHVGLRMPWAWKIGPSYSSERAHFLAMLESEDFPKNTLFCGDAGFVGYDFWKKIDATGHRFLCRVGSNCSFLKKLGRVRERQGIVYCWPKEKQHQKLPPLVMRLLCFHDRRGEVYLVTNELSTKRLSDSLASKIYRSRWGIEVQFRSLKQTFGCSTLLGRTPEVAEQELNWSLVGLWIAQLLALREQTPLTTPDSKTSVAQVLRIFEDILQRPDRVPKPGQSFRGRMAKAITDAYVRNSQKKSRNFPRRKEEPQTGPPKIMLATRVQKKLDKIIRATQSSS